MRVTGISSMATRQVLAELTADWRQRSDIDVAIESVGGIDAVRRLNDGEPFDIVVLADDAIDELIAAGRVVAGSRVPLALSEVAIAVRSGARRARVDTEEALREAVVSSSSVGYSTGPSGVAVRRVFERWRLDEGTTPRLVQAPPGVPVGVLIARGDVELGFQQRSELVHVDGVDVLGPMPPGLEIVTTFTGAICAASAHPAAVRNLLDFLRSPAAEAAKRRHGMAPA